MEELMLSLNFSTLGWKIGLPLILILIDVISGIIQALINDDFHSTTMRQGLYHKVLEILVMIVAFALQFAFNSELVSTVIMGYIVVMELASILENLTHAGLNLGPLSKMLRITGNTKVADVLDKTVEENAKK